MNTFNSNTSINQVKISADSIAAMMEDKSKLNETRNILNKYGFLIVANAPGKEVSDIEVRKNVLDMKKLFGDAAYHLRADSDGVAAIGKNFVSNSAKTEELRKMPNKTFKALTSGEFEPHTDASFSKKSDEILSLTCYQPSIDGGESYVVSCLAIYEHVKKNVTSKELEALFRKDCVQFQREGETATKPIFDKDENTGNIKMVWRKDVIVDQMDTLVKPEAHAGVRAIIDFVDNQSNHLVYKLQRNETLICNNSAVLHARKAFPDHQVRRLDRLNFEFVGSGAILDDGRVKLGFKVPMVETQTVFDYQDFAVISKLRSSGIKNVIIGDGLHRLSYSNEAA